jgi:hypothetical protein
MNRLKLKLQLPFATAKVPRHELILTTQSAQVPYTIAPLTTMTL